MKHGVLYPDLAFGTLPHLRKHLGLLAALNKGTEEFERALDELVTAFDRSGAHTMLVSAEAFCVAPLRSPNSLMPLRSMNANFRVEAICLLRRPDYFIESFWNQMCKEGRTRKHIRAFLKTTQAKNYLRYNDFLSEWANASHLRALSFETAREGGIMRTFCDVAKIPRIAEGAVRNISPSMTCAALLASLPPLEGRHYDIRAIDRELGDAARKTALGRKLRKKLLGDFSAQLKILERNYGVAFASDLPDEPHEALPRPQPADIDHFSEPRFIADDSTARNLAVSLYEKFRSFRGFIRSQGTPPPH